MKSFCRVLLIFGVVLCSLSANIWAQQPFPTEEDVFDLPQAPMKNVFLNTIWGSLVGGILYTSLSIVNDSKSTDARFSLAQNSKIFIEGATIGGLFSVAVSLYISLNNVRFRNQDPLSQFGNNSATTTPAQIYSEMEQREQSPKISLGNEIAGWSVRF